MRRRADRTRRERRSGRRSGDPGGSQSGAYRPAIADPALYAGDRQLRRGGRSVLRPLRLSGGDRDPRRCGGAGGHPRRGQNAGRGRNHARPRRDRQQSYGDLPLLALTPPRKAAPGVAGRLVGYITPKYAATSTMRFEKPHSLSYQDRTRTKVLSSTWVWVTSKVELCGSWLKSTETVGALLMPTMPLRRFDFAASSISVLTSSAEVSRAASNVKSIRDTLAVGTRIAVPSSLPLSAGKTRPDRKSTRLNS